MKMSILDFKSFQEWDELHHDIQNKRDLASLVALGRLEFIYSEPSKMMDSRMMVENAWE
jgi:hypothetical protein